MAEGRLRCQRIGCDAFFTQEDNPDGSCHYHPSGELLQVRIEQLDWIPPGSSVAMVLSQVSGSDQGRASVTNTDVPMGVGPSGQDLDSLNEGPIFHDGMKEWSCCQKRSHDFSLFLQIPGCQTGQHTTEKPVLAKPAAKPVNPVRLATVVSTGNSSLKEDCPRCKQGFFCSDHGLQAKEVIPTKSNADAKSSSAPVKKVVDINEPQTCRNKGCGQTFKEKDNHAEACSYHPGPAVFHDRMKGWQCCDIHVKEFDEFVTIPPCAKGWHNADPSA